MKLRNTTLKATKQSQQLCRKTSPQCLQNQSQNQNNKKSSSIQTKKTRAARRIQNIKS